MIETDSVATRSPLEPFVLDGRRVMVGDLVLDLAQHTIHSRSMRLIKLSANEFIIVATLIKCSGRYVSKDDLLTAVAGSEIDPHPSIVDTYIKFLHRQLQEAGSSATIEKQTGVGFRLCP